MVNIGELLSDIVVEIGIFDEKLNMNFWTILVLGLICPNSW